MSDAVQIIEKLLVKHAMPPVGQRPFDLTLGAIRQPASDLFLDIGFVLWRETQGGPIQSYLYRCVTSPGLSAIVSPTNPRGIFQMRDDFRTPKLWRPGYHNQRAYGLSRPALVQDSKAVVYGWRDNDRDTLLERLIVSIGDAAGINHHNGMRDNGMLTQKVGRNSEGCRVTSTIHIGKVRGLVQTQAAFGLGELVSDHLFALATNPEAAPIFDLMGIPIRKAA